jgi:decaprenylphospho-beta-D-ribofuranose 2-oxidase
MTSVPPSPLTARPGERVLTGWGRTSPSAATVRLVESAAEVSARVREAGPRGVLARGLGRSYGDAAQSGGATVLDLSPMRGIDLDPASGVVTAGAGLSLDALMRVLVPAGFFVPVTPGTRIVTVGGAIAADVHGKNHHREGTFGAHVQRMTVVDGRGDVVALDPQAEADRFWATVGGMGLTGVILDATFDLIPITSSLISVDTERGTDVDDVMDRMIARDEEYRYSVAWIDSVHPSGRGVLTRGDHVPAEWLSGRQAADPLAFAPKSLATAPPLIPGGLVNPLSMRAFNEAWFRKAPRHRVGELQSIGAFFHPLDIVQDWNRVYGPKGFLQYQFAVPDAAGHLVRTALRRLRDVGALSALTVLKRFGAANPGPLSFPQPGWTLAVDVPAGVDGLAGVLDELDAQVLAEGGRLYLAKDSRMSPATMAASYPRLAEWQRVRDDMDPNGVFTSDLARRLSL